MDMRRIDLTVGVGYESDLSKVKAVLEGVVKTETAVIKDEPVDIFVSDLGDSAVDMGIRVWVKTEDYWPVRRRFGGICATMIWRRYIMLQTIRLI